MATESGIEGGKQERKSKSGVGEKTKPLHQTEVHHKLAMVGAETIR